MRLAYAYPEHLWFERARLLQISATIKALTDAGAGVEFIVGRFRGLNQRLDELGLGGVSGLDVKAVAMWQKGPGKIAPLSWHGVYHRACLKKLSRPAAKGLAAVVVRHLKLADHLLANKSKLATPLVFEAHELFSVTAQEEGMGGEKLSRLRDMEKRVLSGVDRVVAISAPLADELARNWGVRGRVDVLASGVDEMFFEARQDRRKDDLVVYAGGLGPWKGVDLLVDAVAETKSARLEILGGSSESPDWRRLLAMAELAGMSSRITLRRRAGKDQVLDLLERAAIAVWPGTARQRIAAEFTSPLKLFEYMAAGCAVIAPNVPAARAVLRDGQQAVFFEPDDPASLADAIEVLLADRDKRLRLGRSAQELARDYTWLKRAEKLLNIAGEMAA